MCSWADKSCPRGRFEKTCLLRNLIGLSYLSCEKVTRHDYITALVANGGAELSKHTRECVWFYEAFLVWYASRLWCCMPGNPEIVCLGGTDFTHDLL